MKYNLKFDIQLLNGKRFKYSLDQTTKEPKEIDWDKIKKQCRKAKSYLEMAETYKKLLEPFGVTVRFKKRFCTGEIELLKIKGLKQKKLYIPPCFDLFRYTIYDCGKIEAWAKGLRFEEVEYDNPVDKEISLAGLFTYLKQKKLAVNITHPENIHDMDYMFTQCSLLEEVTFIDAYKLGQSSVESLQAMFCNCSKLKKIRGLECLNTANLYLIDILFYGCKSLTDISFMKNWDTSTIAKMDRTFCGCESLEDISSLKNFNTKNLSNTDSMFSGCIKLRDISPLKNWNTLRLESAGEMFKGCTQLESILPLKNWNTKYTHILCGIFKDCTQLKSVKPIVDWDVQRAYNLNEILKNCINVQDAILLESWKPKIVKGGFCREAFQNTGTAVNQVKYPSWYKV